MIEKLSRENRATIWLGSLWVVFLAVQALEIRLGWVLPNQPMGDVYNVYEPWSIAAANGHVVGITEPWVYPPLALIPMLAPRLLWGIPDYTLAWAVFVALLNAVAFGLLLRGATSRARRTAAIFWILFLACFGPVTFFRLDGVTVPLAIVGVLYLGSRPAAASLCLALGTWMKIWPAAILLAAFAVLRQRWALFWPAAVSSLLIIAYVLFSGGAANLFGFLTMQSDRGMQVEAPTSLPWLWAAAAHVPGTGVVYNGDIVTFQVTGAGTEVAAMLMTPLLVIFSCALAGLAFLRVRAGVDARRMLPPLALALVLCFIVFNKVGSPQFQGWLVAPIVLWLLRERRAASRYAVGVLVAALLTQFVYPIMYDKVIIAELSAVLILSARNILLIALLVAVIAHIVRLPIVSKRRAAMNTTERQETP